MLNLRLEADAIKRIAEMIDYDPVTGIFTRRAHTGSRWRAGQVAGTYDAKGYVVLNVGGKRVKAHRLAWFIVHGELPALIDHINRDPADNRIANLRAATRQVNTLNSERPRADNTRSGLLGVSKISGRSKRWAARIGIDGRRVHIGSFATPEEAHAAYLAAKDRLLTEATNAD